MKNVKKHYEISLKVDRLGYLKSLVKFNNLVII